MNSPPSDVLTRGLVVVVEGTVAGRPIAMIMQGQDERGRWKLKVTGARAINLGNQKHGKPILIDGEPWTVTGHNGNHLRAEPVEVGMRLPPPKPRRRRVRRKVKEGEA